MIGTLSRKGYIRETITETCGRGIFFNGFNEHFAEFYE